MMSIRKRVSNSTVKKGGPQFLVLLAAFISCSLPAGADTALWNPLSRQQSEADTVFMPDLSSVGAIDAEGGFLLGPSNKTSADVVGSFQFGPGKFGPAVRGAEGANNYVYYPIDGLAPTDEFTVEFWARSDQPWSALTTRFPIFALDGGNYLGVMPFDGKLTVQAGSFEGMHGWNQPLDALHLNDTQWHEIGLTYKDQTLRIYVDGADVGQINNVKFLPVWSEEGVGGKGLELGGGHNRASGFWISDVRISRTARVPGQSVTLRSLAGSWKIDTRSEGARPLTLTVGSVHPFGTPEEVRAVSNVMRTDKLLSVTPIVPGTPDAEHPAPGHSGRYAYNWAPVDHVLEWYVQHGLAAYLSIDSAPSLLGGQVLPFSGADLTTRLSRRSQFNRIPPNDTNAWVAMVTDLVYHIRREKNFHVGWYGFWNEPDIVQFWTGTQDQIIDLYAATMPAVHEIDPDAKIGGPELANFNAAWIKRFLERCAANKLPLDFVSYHDYSGDLAHFYVVRYTVDKLTTSLGLRTPMPIVVGEFNWSGHAYWKHGYARYSQTPWHLRAFGAAYDISTAIALVELPAFDLLLFFSTGGVDPTIGGDRVLQLMGPNNEHWATYNAFKGWKQTVGKEVLAASPDLPPGVHALATREPETGRIGLVLTNYGYAQRHPRTITLALEYLPDGAYTLTRFLVDPRHSSRWDVDENRPEGVAYDSLQMVESRQLSAQQSRPLTLQVELPVWSSTFISISPAR
jgi:hypothetical protein